MFEDDQLQLDTVGLLSPDQDWVIACGLEESPGPAELIAPRRSSLTNASANVCLEGGKRTVLPN